MCQLHLLRQADYSATANVPTSASTKNRTCQPLPGCLPHIATCRLDPTLNLSLAAIPSEADTYCNIHDETVTYDMKACSACAGSQGLQNGTIAGLVIGCFIAIVLLAVVLSRGRSRGIILTRQGDLEPSIVDEPYSRERRAPEGARLSPVPSLVFGNKGRAEQPAQPARLSELPSGKWSSVDVSRVDSSVA